MLDGKQPLSIKRAVFLAEWAYLDGNLDYEEYNNTIDAAASWLKRFINANELEKYKTGKNMALIEYFFRPYSGNNYKPFVYDFSDTCFTQQFVSKVMQTHSGQCRSLPMYYKILAEAIGAEAYITYAPLHVFIRYRDEDNLFPEDWVNVETSTRQLTPEFWYRERFRINERTIETKVYLHPLTDKETVASQLADLAFGYRNKFKIYDDFTLLCVNKALEFYPQKPNALIIKGKSLHSILIKHLEYNGYRMDKHALFLESRLDKVTERIEHLGWTQTTSEMLEKIGKEMGLE